MIRLACMECHRQDFDDIEDLQKAIAAGWKDIGVVQTYAEACTTYENTGDAPTTIRARLVDASRLVSRLCQQMNGGTRVPERLIPRHALFLHGMGLFQSGLAAKTWTIHSDSENIFGITARFPPRIAI